MTTKKTITLGEANGLVRLINVAISKVDILPYKLAHRLNRQLTKLKEVPKLAIEAQQASLIAILGEEEFQKLQGRNEEIQFSEIMTDEQLNEFNELIEKENEADYDAQLLSESFEGLIPDGAIDTSAAMALSAIVVFFEEQGVWAE